MELSQAVECGGGRKKAISGGGHESEEAKELGRLQTISLFERKKSSERQFSMNIVSVTTGEAIRGTYFILQYSRVRWNTVSLL